MNEEHFLTELKIYLNPLPKEKSSEILQSFQELFTEGKEGEMAEEEIAKSLGKPKDIAQEALSFYHIKLQEKPIYQNDWQEIPPQYEDLDDEDDRFYQEENYQNKRTEGNTLSRILMLLFHLFVGIWAVLSVYLALFGAWVTAAFFLLMPIFGATSFFLLPTPAAIMSLFFSFIFVGIGLFMVAVGRPITSFFHQLSKKYIRFAHRVIKEGL